MASSSNEVITLNVGGTMYTTTATTLLGPTAAGSMLARLVSLHLNAQHSSSTAGCGTTDTSSAWESTNNGAALAASLVDPCLAGALFIDRDGPMFGYVLSYLRNGDALVPPADIPASQQLLQEANYYGMGGMVALLQQHLTQFKLREDSRQRMIESTIDWQKEMQSMLRQHMLHQRKGGDELRECLKEMKMMLDDMHLYVKPKNQYHIGKRGGPNYNKPYTLQDDLAEIVEKQDLLDK